MFKKVTHGDNRPGKISNVAPRAAIYFVDGIEGIFLGKHAHAIFYFQVKIIRGTEPTRN
jgi:hypothetical protein